MWFLVDEEYWTRLLWIYHRFIKIKMNIYFVTIFFLFLNFSTCIFSIFFNFVLGHFWTKLTLSWTYCFTYGTVLVQTSSSFASYFFSTHILVLNKVEMRVAIKSDTFTISDFGNRSCQSLYFCKNCKHPLKLI